MCVGLRVISFVILWINCWILNAKEKLWTITYKNATHISYNNVDIDYDAIAELMRIALENAKESNHDDTINNILQGIFICIYIFIYKQNILNIFIY